jgi:GNAT superfamily N-acetyltransferase
MQVAASCTYVVYPSGSNRIMGYFALNMGQILAQDVTGSTRRNMPLSIPAVILGRLAIDLGWQAKGLGRVMLADVICRAQRASAEVSARLVMVHAISPAAEAFYLHHGFTRLPVEAPTLALDMSSLRGLNPDPRDAFAKRNPSLYSETRHRCVTLRSPILCADPSTRSLLRSARNDGVAWVLQPVKNQ